MVLVLNVHRLVSCCFDCCFYLWYWRCLVPKVVRLVTETEMSFCRNFHHWLHRKLSFWQLPVQPVMEISLKWRHFHFGVSDIFLCMVSVTEVKVGTLNYDENHVPVRPLLKRKSCHSSCWHFRHWLPWEWQLPVQRVTKISSKCWHFPFNHAVRMRGDLGRQGLLTKRRKLFARLCELQLAQEGAALKKIQFIISAPLAH